MLRHIFIAAFCFSPAVLPAQETFKLTSGATIKLSGGTVITLDNMHLDNDGTISLAAGDGTFRFAGNATSNILGSNSPLFDRMEIAKTGGAQLTLQRNIGVLSRINFTSGLFNLNGNNILLQPAALLNGESVASYITGINGGFVEIRKTLNVPVSENPGSLGAILTSSQNLGSTVIRRGHQSQINGSGNGNSILRYYDILPANNTALNATLRFSYLDTELNGLAESNLVLWKSADNVNWNNQDYTSRNITANYVEKTNIAGFSRWTLTSPGNPLPVVWGSFNARCANNAVVINWKTLQEDNTKSFIIQRSSNGSNWIEVAVLNAAGQSNSPIDYSFTDIQTSATFYRIIQTDIDGRKTISPVLRSDCDEKDFFNVYPNPVQRDILVAIQSANSKEVLLQVYDNKGALVKQQQENLHPGMNQFSINLASLAAGEYNLLVSWPDGKLKTIKLVKI